MTESEKRALEAYPDAMGPSDKPCLEDDYRVTLKLRKAFEEGYEKALEDRPPICPPLPEPLQLTWKDIRLINLILEKMVDDEILGTEDMHFIGEEDYYTEVLRKFNEKKK